MSWAQNAMQNGMQNTNAAMDSGKMPEGQAGPIKPTSFGDLYKAVQEDVKRNSANNVDVKPVQSEMFQAQYQPQQPQLQRQPQLGQTAMPTINGFNL